MSVSLIDGHIDREKQKYLFYIPARGRYIEILGYKIDGFESFEAFCEHLNKYAEMEKEIEKLHQNLKEAHIDIQEKQEQIEALIAGLETLQKALAEKDAEINNLNDLVVYNVSCATKLHIKLADSKSEAVKEFENFLINNLIREQFSREYVISLIRYYAKERSSE